MNKLEKAAVLLIVIIIMIFISLHITPKMALRTGVFTSGHPVAAIKTGIVDDTLHNKIDSEKLKDENAYCYRLTEPPKEQETDSYLNNWIVKKLGFFYFASYYGEA